MANTLATWLIILVIGGSLFLLFVGNPFIDWLDERFSRITPDEARLRARLAAEGKWPQPDPRPWSTKAEWVSLLVGIVLIAAMTGCYRYWSR